MPRNRNVWFISLTCVEKHAWNFRLGVIQASLLMDDLFMDDLYRMPILLFLPWTTFMDELGVGLFHNTPSVSPLSREMYSLMLFFGCMPLCQWLGVLRVTILLVTSHVDSFFRGVCHMSPVGWSCRFRCQSPLPINS